MKSSTSASTISPTTGLITFYDIALATPPPPLHKNRLLTKPLENVRSTLNFKNTPCKTKWVPLPAITSVRSALDIPASRKIADRSPYHTIPNISDPATGRMLGGSFSITAYLQEQSPSSGVGDLFPAQNLEFMFGRYLGLYALFAEA
ncbi:hypothetical protein PENCOP_c005G03659 [Penicillium coprophilum]|uniref:Uncharacterized protein n=1 Tax=Penicillium coprophilum TaxID=36646 RepID=A0A1V6US05_9EURO|nr:hypothetical protein PENCOP_c005G03659 [Penicillium coprophilum]